MKTGVLTNRFLREVYTKGKSILLAVLPLLITLNSSFAQNELSTGALDSLKQAYLKIKTPEITFDQFVAIHSYMFTKSATRGARVDALTAAAAPQDTYCSKVRTYCANGDFEAGLDQNQWTGAYGFDFTGIYPNPFTLTYGFIGGALNSSAAHQTIVDKSSGNDPTTGIPLVPANGGNKSLRLGNSATGNGTEVLAKTIVVDPNETILSFYYAVVFEDPGHNFNDQPAFSVRGYDCVTGLELKNICDLGNGTNVVVSDAQNPFFKSAQGGNIAYRDWSLAQVNLSAYVGKTVILVFENKDCNLGGHYGYTYLDNIFSTLCPINGPVLTGQGSITVNKTTTSTCGTGNICVDYTVPSSNSATGNVTITLDVYQNGTKITTLTSPTFTSNSSYCFAINPSTLGLDNGAGGFDYSVTGRFALSGFALAPITLGSPPNGQVSGANNDYMINCVVGTVYYSKSTGDLHNLLTWGLNPDGSGANPTDFGAGKTFNLANRFGSTLTPAYVMTGNWTVEGIVNLTNCTGVLAINGFTLSVNHLTGFGCSSSTYLEGGTTSNLIITGNVPGAETFPLAGVNSGRVMILNNLTIDRPGAAASVILGNQVYIHGILAVNNGNLTLSPVQPIGPMIPPDQVNGLILVSDATNTARVAPIPTTASITGNVTVERYIPARRAWRLLAAPIGSQFINAAWQEGATTFSANPNPHPGFGTHITQSASSGLDGLDFNSAIAMSSLKRYSNPTNSWVPVLDTRNTTVFSDAWFIFVRGDRGINMGFNTVAPNNTTLRCLGPLRIGDQTFPIAASGLNAIPNPYASPLNFASIAAHNPNIVNSFTVVDPKLGSTGAFVNVSFNPTTSTYEVTPAAASPINELIQSGQGFLVQSKGAAGSLVIKETDKSQTAAADVFRLADRSTERQAVATSKGLRINLQANNDGKYEVLDEVFSSYNEGYSNGLDDLDAIKATNPEENLGIVTEGKTVMVDRRKPIAENEVIQLRLWNTNERDYVLKFNPINLSSIKVPALVFDNYNKTYTPIDLNNQTEISFTVTSDATSKDPYRFKVVFSDKKVNAQMAVTSEMIRVVPNPINDRTINLQLSDLPQGIYGVQLLDNTGRIVHSSKLSYPGGNGTQNINLNNKLIKGVYQLRLSSDKFSKTLKIFSN